MPINQAVDGIGAEPMPFRREDARQIHSCAESGRRQIGSDRARAEDFLAVAAMNTAAPVALRAKPISLGEIPATSAELGLDERSGGLVLYNHAVVAGFLVPLEKT